MATHRKRAHCDVSVLKHLVHQRDGNRSLADRRCHTLDVARSDVARFTLFNSTAAADARHLAPT